MLRASDASRPSLASSAPGGWDGKLYLDLGLAFAGPVAAVGGNGAGEDQLAVEDLEDAGRHERRHRAVRRQTRDEPLPDRLARAEAVPEAHEPGVLQVARADRRGLGRHPRPVPGAAGVGIEAVLADGDRVEVDDPRALLQVAVNVADDAVLIH